MSSSLSFSFFAYFYPTLFFPFLFISDSPLSITISLSVFIFNFLFFLYIFCSRLQCKYCLSFNQSAAYSTYLYLDRDSNCGTNCFYHFRWSRYWRLILYPPLPNKETVTQKISNCIAFERDWLTTWNWYKKSLASQKDLHKNDTLIKYKHCFASTRCFYASFLSQTLNKANRADIPH